jgi:hypothetical protein
MYVLGILPPSANLSIPFQVEGWRFEVNVIVHIA